MITKTTMVVIFNLQNSHLLTLSLPTEEVFQVNGQNRLVANLPVVDFHSQPREMLTPKPPNTWLSVFLWVYWFSSPSIRVWTSLSVSDAVFFSVLAAIIRESSDKQLVLRIVKALPFIHQPDRVASKASDVSAADWLYQHRWKNTIFFHVCCYGFSQGWKSLNDTVFYMINNNRKLTILRLWNVSRKECWTIAYGVGTGPLISILFSSIHWLSSPDLTSGMCT